MDTTYRTPDWFTRNVLNRLVAGATRAGVSILGSRELEVRGRRSGQTRRTPVNLLDLDGARYLVAPRGETEWVRNVRAADGAITLRRGRHRESFRAVELVDEAKAPVLRAYLRRWKFEVGMFFEGVGPDSSDAELTAAGSRHPVFVLQSERP
ncbi:MAG: nitroreductase family deazaflavin-dependent oxidoreductase [Acidobacteriota bacterium]|nr:nitroreductase family deazaflavin-dependent oxidoreductase [Acidobacteriota bacterium]